MLFKAIIKSFTNGKTSFFYAETTTDSTTRTTEIQTTPFIVPGPNVTLGEDISRICVRD